MELLSFSLGETQKIAALLAEEITKTKNRPTAAFVVGLEGNLGAGKTAFVQGFARGLGLKHKITSPTFLIVRNYGLRNKNYGRFYHIDAYRIKKTRELVMLGIKKILTDPQNIVVIEWADKMKRLLPPKTIWAKLKPGRKESERIISFSSWKK